MRGRCSPRAGACCCLTRRVWPRLPRPLHRLLAASVPPPAMMPPRQPQVENQRAPRVPHPPVPLSSPGAPVVTAPSARAASQRGGWPTAGAQAPTPWRWSTGPSAGEAELAAAFPLTVAALGLAATRCTPQPDNQGVPGLAPAAVSAAAPAFAVESPNSSDGVAARVGATRPSMPALASGFSAGSRTPPASPQRQGHASRRVVTGSRLLERLTGRLARHSGAASDGGAASGAHDRDSDGASVRSAPARGTTRATFPAPHHHAATTDLHLEPVRSAHECLRRSLEGSPDAGAALARLDAIRRLTQPLSPSPHGVRPYTGLPQRLPPPSRGSRHSVATRGSAADGSDAGAGESVTSRVTLESVRRRAAERQAAMADAAREFQRFRVSAWVSLCACECVRVNVCVCACVIFLTRLSLLV